MKTLRILLFLLLAGIAAMTLFTGYSLYLSLTGEIKLPQLVQILMKAVFLAVFALVVYRSFRTLSTGVISEKTEVQGGMKMMTVFLCMLGFPAIIVPGIMLWNSIPDAPERSIAARRLGVERAGPEWNPETGLVLAFFAGIVLVAYAFLYPAYLRRLQKQRSGGQ